MAHAFAYGFSLCWRVDFHTIEDRGMVADGPTGLPVLLVRFRELHSFVVHLFVDPQLEVRIDPGTGLSVLVPFRTISLVWGILSTVPACCCLVFVARCLASVQWIDTAMGNLDHTAGCRWGLYGAFQALEVEYAVSHVCVHSVE